MEGKNTSLALDKSVLELDLSALNLGRFPLDILQCTKLRTLNLSNNRLKRIPSALFFMPSLRDLNLSGNKITELDILSEGVSKIRKLNLSSNKLLDLPPFLSQLKELSELNLSGNKIQHSRMDWSSLFMLRKLSLSSNALMELEEGIAQCRLLRVLDVSKNKLTNLPKSYNYLSQLEVLDVSDNPLEGFFPEKGSWPYLKSLDLSKTKLEKLRSCYMDFPKLRQLNIGNIKVDEFLVLTMAWRIEGFKSRHAVSELRKFGKKCALKEIPKSYWWPLFKVYKGREEVSVLAEEEMQAGLKLAFPSLNTKIRRSLYSVRKVSRIEDIEACGIYFDSSCAIGRIIKEEWLTSISAYSADRKSASLFVYGASIRQIPPRDAMSLIDFISILSVDIDPPRENQRRRLSSMLLASSENMRALAFSVVLKRLWLAGFRDDLKKMTTLFSDPLSEAVKRFLKAERTP